MSNSLRRLLLSVAGAVAVVPCQPALAILRGDINCDGVINGKDVQAWVDARMDPAAYAAKYPNCSRCAADFNGDGQLTDADQALFIACLLNTVACLAHTPCFCPLPLVPSGAMPAPDANDPAFAVGVLADFNDRNVIRAGGDFPEIPATLLEQDGQQTSFGWPIGGQDAINGYDMSGRIRYPAGGGGGLNAPVAASGPFPLVVIAHGNHTPFAFGGGTDPSSENYRGYTYLQNRLATHGFVSVSIDLDDFSALFPGILARAWLVMCAVEYMDRLNSATGTLQNAIDINNRVALIGHSRGGEAVVQAVRLNATGAVPGIGPGTTTGPFPILAVIGVASTRFFDGNVNYDLRLAAADAYQATVPASVLAGGSAPQFLGMWGDADGDVDGSDSSGNAILGSGFFEMRPEFRGVASHVVGTYDGSAPRPKQFVWIEGANHNYWNTSWYGNIGMPNQFGDDGNGVVTTRITDAQQQAILSAYAVAFLRGYVRAQSPANNQAAYRNYFRFQPNQLSPGGVAAARAHLQYQELDSNRRIVDSFEANCALGTTSTGQGVVATGTLTNPEEGELIGAYDHPPTSPLGCAAAMNSQSWYHNTRGFLTEWTAAGNVYDTITLAGQRNVSGFEVLSFRIAQDYRDADSQLATLALEVQLRDGSATPVTTSILTGTITTIPIPQKRDDDVLLSKSMLKTIRIPLCRFKEVQPNLDLTNIVRVRFTNFDRAAGKFGIDDIEFSK